MKLNEKSKKVFKILLVILILTIYCNIGYYYGESYYNACVKHYAGGQLNTFEKFQAGAGRYWARNTSPKTIMEKSYHVVTLVIFTMLWPIGFLFHLMSWLVYGVIYLFKLIFCGGFFRLIFN